MAQRIFERNEQKYLLTTQQKNTFLKELSNIVEPDEYGEYTTCSLYYDTPEFDSIKEKMNKPRYKEKLRLRSYGVPKHNSTVFIELKKKLDGITYKRREELQYSEAIDFLEKGIHPQKQSQILDEIEWVLKTKAMIPKAVLTYDRIAFSEIENPDVRITIDKNILWRTQAVDITQGIWGRALIAPNEHLVEIKVPESMPYEIAKILSNIQAYPTSFSKYGTAYQEIIETQEENRYVG